MQYSPADSAVVRQYIELLEKTNQQLGLWTNPYGMMIAALAILFTILTIVAVIIVYILSKEFRTSLSKSLAKNEGLINEIAKNGQAIIDQKKAEIASLMAQMNEAINALEDVRNKIPQEQIEEVEKVNRQIKDLRDQIEKSQSKETNWFNNPSSGQTVMAFHAPIFPDLSGSIFNPSRASVTCKNCGTQFYADKPPDGQLAFGEYKAKCPTCGTENKVTFLW